MIIICRPLPRTISRPGPDYGPVYFSWLYTHILYGSTGVRARRMFPTFFIDFQPAVGGAPESRAAQSSRNDENVEGKKRTHSAFIPSDSAFFRFINHLAADYEICAPRSVWWKVFLCLFLLLFTASFCCQRKEQSSIVSARPIPVIRLIWQANLRRLHRLQRFAPSSIHLSLSLSPSKVCKMGEKLSQIFHITEKGTGQTSGEEKRSS